MKYTVWLTEYSDPNHVWVGDEQIVLADIRSAWQTTVENARVALMQSTPENPLKLESKGYEVWIEMEKN